jgi:hypothetical protein
MPMKLRSDSDNSVYVYSLQYTHTYWRSPCQVIVCLASGTSVGLPWINRLKGKQGNLQEYEIWGSQSGVFQCSGLRGFIAVSLGFWLPLCWCKGTPSYSRSDWPRNAMSCPWRQKYATSEVLHSAISFLLICISHRYVFAINYHQDQRQKQNRTACTLHAVFAS